MLPQRIALVICLSLALGACGTDDEAKLDVTSDSAQPLDLSVDHAAPLDIPDVAAQEDLVPDIQTDVMGTDLVEDASSVDLEDAADVPQIADSNSPDLADIPAEDAGTVLMDADVEEEDTPAVDEVEQADEPPTVQITFPDDGAEVSGEVTITATAEDDIGVKRVDFYVDGKLTIIDWGAPFEADWDTAGLEPKSYLLKAVAMDTANQTASDEISVTVGKNIAPDNCPGDGDCTNASDALLLETVEQQIAVAEKVASCGVDCLEAADVTSCTTLCVKDSTGLTIDCSACQAGVFGCLKDNCLAECQADPESMACQSCQVDAGCFDDYCTCSGLSWPIG